MRVVCWITKAKDTHSEYIILLLFHCNIGCTNAPQRYVIRSLLVLFKFSERFLNKEDGFSDLHKWLFLLIDIGYL